MAFTFKPLWVKLVENDMTKEQLRLALGISSATIAKMGKGEYVSMEVLDKLCNYFDVPIDEIVTHIKNEPTQD